MSCGLVGDAVVGMCVHGRMALVRSVACSSVGLGWVEGTRSRQAGETMRLDYREFDYKPPFRVSPNLDYMGTHFLRALQPVGPNN